MCDKGRCDLLHPPCCLQSLTCFVPAPSWQCSFCPTWFSSQLSQHFPSLLPDLKDAKQGHLLKAASRSQICERRTVPHAFVFSVFHASACLCFVNQGCVPCCYSPKDLSHTGISVQVPTRRAVLQPYWQYACLPSVVQNHRLSQ